MPPDPPRGSHQPMTADREQLAERNRLLAQAIHSPSSKQQLRRALLQAISHVPVPQQQTRTGRKRVLLIRPDHLGDVLLMTPALHHLRRALPGAEIHGLIGANSAQILANNADIDQVLTLAFPGFTRAPVTDSAAAPYQLAFETARRLRRIGYSHALILRPDHWWGALVAFLAGIPTRIGFALPEVSGFLTHPVPCQHEHAVIQNARLTEPLAGAFDPALLRLRLAPTQEDQAAAAEWLRTNAISAESRIIAIQPGAGALIKRWEARKWALVADRLSAEMGAQIVFTGTDGERDLIRDIGLSMTAPYKSAAGQTSIGMLAALYERSHLVLGADSGPMHIAAAMNAPTVTLYGPADTTEFGTWGSPGRHPVVFSAISCRPCRILDWGTDDLAFHPCVRDITTAQVLNAARQAVAAEE